MPITVCERSEWSSHV